MAANLKASEGTAERPAGSGPSTPTGSAADLARARRSHYEPGTFQERGAVIPFTTTTLAQCRLRLDDRKRLEVVLPGFSGGKGAYVTPLSSLPEITTLSVHDRALTEIIAAAKTVTPTGMRRCWLELATTGIGGQALAEQAREELASVAEVQLSTRIMLLLDTARRGGGKVGPELAADIGSTEARRQVRQALAGAAARAGVEAVAVDRHIGELSMMLGTVGLRALPQHGRLRGQQTGMQEFAHAIDNWSRTTVSDLAHVGRLAAMSADHSAAIAGSVIAELDSLLSDPIRLLSHWDSVRGTLQALLLRLAWLLDGWDYVLHIWDDALAQRIAIDAGVSEIGRILPIVPVREVDSGAGRRSAELFRAYRSRVRGAEDWLSGDIDEARPAVAAASMAASRTGSSR